MAKSRRQKMDSQTPHNPISQWVLKVERGPAKGSIFSIKDVHNIIGRKIDASIPVLDLSVSREHAAIDVENGSAFLVDLKSCNGTMLNNKRLENRSEIQLGDRVQLGDTLFKITLGQDEKKLNNKEPADNGILKELTGSGEFFPLTNEETFAESDFDLERNNTFAEIAFSKDTEQMKKVRLFTVLGCATIISAAIMVSFFYR